MPSTKHSRFAQSISMFMTAVNRRKSNLRHDPDSSMVESMMCEMYDTLRWPKLQGRYKRSRSLECLNMYADYLIGVRVLGRRLQPKMNTTSRIKLNLRSRLNRIGRINSTKFKCLRNNEILIKHKRNIGKKKKSIKSKKLNR